MRWQPTVSPSAYDTAWLAMIPDSHERFKPMFGNCLNWILNNQNQHYGFWGDCDVHGMPTIECLTATLACVVALNRWNIGTVMINKGLAYVHSSNAEKVLKEIKDQCPRWFAIVFPAMVELSQEIGLKIEINEALLSDIFYQRQRILDKEELVKDYQYPPLLSYFEALPSSYDVEQEDILNHLSCDGSLFQSPSATACAFMAYGNTACLSYLQAMVQKCPHGVPNTYPIDEELIRLSVINHVQRSGLAEHFTRETKQVLEQVYKATDLAFPGEHDLEETRSFSRKLLEKSVSLGAGDQIPLRRLIEDELRFQWMARLDHLEHRMWIEESEINVMWAGKASFQRLSSLHNDKLVRLAMENYKFRQAIYQTELDQLKRWSKDWGLNDMGFGREKTTYCYFAIAASCNLPCDSYIRMIVAKSAIIITVADDFFDTKGTPTELRSLTDAVQRWDAKGLCSDAKTIFLALDNLWYETFLSWLTESEWSRSNNVPSMEEYLQVGMKSIATHTLVLPASCYLKPSLPNSKLRPRQYESLTELVMTIPRLLNDLQSFEGKIKVFEAEVRSY
ncbi:Squalene/phytoene synthase [Trema orientale]|uniref:Squalene/phytoene synthase n=1 Tax=Trema orientale TaxID=63057 RepID=A0A2P5EXE0_TREOI|nr:Squalene/phytoene synthase [Trema orientale]